MSKSKSGKLGLANNIITYDGSDDGWLPSWSLKLEDIRIIGEYTTANGPYVDDYFFVFLTAAQGGWHQASFYADGRDEFLGNLSETLGTPITPGLLDHTDYQTRIMWPESLKGQPLMRIVPKPTKIGRLLSKISGREDIVLADSAKAVFKK